MVSLLFVAACYGKEENICHKIALAENFSILFLWLLLDILHNSYFTVFYTCLYVCLFCY